MAKLMRSKLSRHLKIYKIYDDDVILEVKCPFKRRKHKILPGTKFYFLAHRRHTAFTMILS